jgi:hypothetical protein
VNSVRRDPIEAESREQQPNRAEEGGEDRDDPLLRQETGHLLSQRAERQRQLRVEGCHRRRDAPGQHHRRIDFGSDAQIDRPDPKLRQVVELGDWHVERGRRGLTKGCVHGIRGHADDLDRPKGHRRPRIQRERPSDRIATADELPSESLIDHRDQPRGIELNSTIDTKKGLVSSAQARVRLARQRTAGRPAYRPTALAA